MESLDNLAVVHPNAAGLDIGSREIWAAVCPDHDGETVRRFATFTPDLEALAERPEIGPMQALVATAHKIARTVYFMLKNRVAYHDIGAQGYEAAQRERELAALQRKAARLGFDLIPKSAPAGNQTVRSPPPTREHPLPMVACFALPKIPFSGLKIGPGRVQNLLPASLAVPQARFPPTLPSSCRSLHRAPNGRFSGRVAGGHCCPPAP